jgi:enterochelin esterase-like enzyme
MRRLPLLIAVLALTDGAVGAQQPSLPTPPRGHPILPAPESPRIAELRERLRRGDSTALATFWARAASERTPIIETIPGDSARVLATFVYRDTTPLSNVVISGGVAGWVDALTVMEHVAGTDLWYKSVPVRKDIRIWYQFRKNDSLFPWFVDPNFPKRWAAGFADPLNPKVEVLPAGPRSVFEGPTATPQPWVVARPGVAHGKLTAATLTSSHLHEQRDLWVYTPPGYDSAAARRAGGLPELVLFDGGAYTGRLVPTPTILDNMLADRRIAPIIVVFIANGSQRMQELAANPDFADFVADEVMPWVRQRYAVTSSPRKTAIGGSSHGALMATFVALRYPGLFGQVISQSASHWWGPEGEDGEWLSRTVATIRKLPVRFYMEVGVYETDRSANQGPGQVWPNRHFRDVLRAKGYDVDYREFAGAHEYLNWRGTISEALMHFFPSAASRSANSH